MIEACADRRRAGGWITDEIRDAYVELHRLGWAHSVEAWSRDDDSLCGGLYGVAIGGLFAGESMFHRRTDASKVALVGLVERLHDPGRVGPGRAAGCSTSNGAPTTSPRSARSRCRGRSYLDLLAAALAAAVAGGASLTGEWSPCRTSRG